MLHDKQLDERNYFSELPPLSQMKIQIKFNNFVGGMKYKIGIEKAKQLAVDTILFSLDKAYNHGLKEY